jgi:hypothetical protein
MASHRRGDRPLRRDQVDQLRRKRDAHVGVAVQPTDLFRQGLKPWIGGPLHPEPKLGDRVGVAQRAVRFKSLDQSGKRVD